MESRLERQTGRHVGWTSKQRDRKAGRHAGGQTIRENKQAEGEEGMYWWGSRQAEVQIGSSRPGRRVERLAAGNQA